MKKLSPVKRRRGAAAIMALVMAIISAVLLQAYLTKVTGDLTASAALDRHLQFQGERVAVERVVKEAILQYYEMPRFGTAPPSVDAVIVQLLDQMSSDGEVTFSLQSSPTLPGSTSSVFNPDSFWAALTGDETPIGNGFVLKENSLEQSHKRAYSFLPWFPALEVVNDSSGDFIFPFVVQRSGTGGTVTFQVNVRMWQVPVSDFNLVSYVIAEDQTSLPDDPPALSAGLSSAITSAQIAGLCMSKMPEGNAVHSPTVFPYYYRDLFSAASLVWEYMCYHEDYLATLFEPTEVPISDVTDAVGGALYNSAVDEAGDPVVLVPGLSYEDGVWTINLAGLVSSSVAAPNGQHYRYVWMDLPGGSAPPDTSIRILHDASDVDEPETGPVFIWINGWYRTDAAYAVTLEGDLSAQHLFLFVAGATLHCEDAVANGVVWLDDKFTALDLPAADSLVLDGSFAWNGARSEAGGPINVASGLAVGRGGNAFRDLSPRFLLVDTASTLSVN